MPSSEPDVSIVRSGPQREQAYAGLREVLILHQAPEGKRLNEEYWSQRLQVNRAALREAFARLEAEGLINKGALPGYFVPKLTQDDLVEITEVRVMLEGGAIDRICRLGLNTPQNLASLRKCCDRLAELAKSGEYAEIAQADRAFHEALIVAAQNARLTIMYERAPLPLLPPDVVRGQEWMARVERTIEEHRLIVECLFSGDLAGALTSLRTHLRERFHIPLRVV